MRSWVRPRSLGSTLFIVSIAVAVAFAALFLRKTSSTSGCLGNGGLYSSGGRVESGDVSAEASAIARNHKQQRIFTVFSTECSPFHDWQSQTLLYSHDTRRVGGEVVRLMSCDDPTYVVPRHSHGGYRVVRTPNFNALYPDDDYTPRNKASALSYWLHGRGNDTDLPDDDDVVVLVDPDHVFLSYRMNISTVRSGAGVAGRYALGRAWVKKWGVPFCAGKCDELEDDYDPSYGVPQVLTAGDTRRHVDLWKVLTEEMRNRTESKGWMTEMFSCILAARRLDIRFEVQDMMISAATSITEPWEHIQWNRSPSGGGLLSRPGGGLAVPIVHYCQTYKISTFSWSKHSYRGLDIRACDRSNNFPPPTGNESSTMVALRNTPLTVPIGQELPTNRPRAKEAVQVSRNVWLLDNTWGIARQAIDAYYEEFCSV